ncbi:MAG: glycoside hydrolase domain-containing protein [Pirellulaceae bacterium]
MRRSALTVFLLLVPTAALSADGTLAPLEAWWVDSLQQVLVEDLAPASAMPGELHAARGEYEAIQVAVRGPASCRVTLKAPPFGSGLEIRIRTVGRVPIVRGTHHTPKQERVAEPPAELPDPLFPGDTRDLSANQTECFWLDVKVPETAAPGEYRSRIEVISEETTLELPLVLKVYQAIVPFDGQLLLTNWFSVRPKEMKFGDAPVGSEEWWVCADQLFDSMWAHRQNMFWTPLGPPFIAPVAGDDGQLGFDFTLFDAWVEAFSRPRGGERRTYIEGQPIAWRQGYDGQVKARIWRIEEGTPRQAIVEVSDPAAREGYRIFLTALRDHLQKKDWLNRFRIHITDEPHGHQLEPYAVLAGYIREFAPEFAIMEALDVKDDFEFFEKHCDVWVPQLGRFDQSLDRMMQRLAAGKEVWIYTCLFPNGAYPNRFVDYPLIKTRVLHWINFRWGFTGYLHWGFNQWRGGDSFRVLEPPHGGSTFLPPGDAWIVYPGERQLLDSMRHEAMRDGVEDYELLRVLASRDGEKAAALAQTVTASFTDYVRDVATFRQVRQQLLDSLD